MYVLPHKTCRNQPGLNVKSKSGQKPFPMGRVLVPDYSKYHPDLTGRQDFVVSWNVPRVALFLVPGAVQVLPYTKDPHQALGGGAIQHFSFKATLRTGSLGFKQVALGPERGWSYKGEENCQAESGKLSLGHQAQHCSPGHQQLRKQSNRKHT